MIKIAIPLALLGLSLTQLTAVAPIRTGDGARQLTEQDVNGLELVLPPDSRPWLLNGDQGQIGNAQFIQAFLYPTTTTVALRRGSVISVMRRISPPTSWTARPAEAYAQVAISGRKFEEIQGDQDINRPFRVLGTFDDNELVQIVAVVRSNSTPGGRGMNAIQPWPILSIDRQGDNSARVMTRGAVMQGQSITLARAGQNWSVVAVGAWIA